MGDARMGSASIVRLRATGSRVKYRRDTRSETEPISAASALSASVIWAAAIIWFGVASTVPTIARASRSA